MSPTLLYDVAFMTYNAPDPERLGTAEKVMGRMRLWGKDADEVISLARSVASAKRMEYLYTISADAVQGVILEQIINDPLNGYDLVEPPEKPREPLTLVTEEG